MNCMKCITGLPLSKKAYSQVKVCLDSWIKTSHRRTKRGKVTMFLRGHCAGLTCRKFLSSCWNKLKARDMKLFGWELKRILLLFPQRTCLKWFLCFFYLCGLEGFSKSVVRIKNHKDPTIFLDVQLAWHKFWVPRNVNSHLSLLEFWLQWLKCYYWGALSTFPGTHIYWVVLKKTSYGLLPN